MNGHDNSERIIPRVAERECGGWLAATPAGSAFSFGVTAASESEAREKFESALTQWFALATSGKQEAL